MNNMFNNFFENQKNMMDSWTDMMKNYQSNFFNMNDFYKGKNPFENFYKMYNQNFLNYTGSPKEVWANLQKSSQIYYDMYEVYKSFVEKNMKPQADLIKKNLEDFMEKSGNYIDDFYSAILPQEFYAVFKQSMELNQAMQKSFNYFYQPLLSSLNNLTDAYFTGMFKDPEGFLDFFEDWRNNYLNTFSKILEMPMMGISRESQEGVLKATDRFIKMIAYQMELITRIVISSNKNTVQVFEDMITRAEKGEQIKSFEEFYQAYRSSLDKAFDQLFYSDEFSKLLAAVLDASMEFKMINDKILEKQLQAFPVVLKSDINSFYKTVYDLKKEVRALKEEIKTLKEAPKSTTRTRTRSTANKTTDSDKKE
ncbi:hypothetical protein KQI68_00520 [Peptoniphilus sp. MSJ-1]|uniref:Poly(3-hydroxyalkanoate) polymerase subunit PhaE n=1 Tax=Peptoniphilus ovalis TaxID=2841503 RepID=A0ABS6FEB5_9FIRM|nr:poly(R)-hydroxyalkanoic acid synthase subunit PhaE [Peptoniphilus ovalis]MBU5668314.1 hypothetical protein [Peptoniphilus ovalis]